MLHPPILGAKRGGSDSLVFAHYEIWDGCLVVAITGLAGAGMLYQAIGAARDRRNSRHPARLVRWKSPSPLSVTGCGHACRHPRGGHRRVLPDVEPRPARVARRHAGVQLRPRRAGVERAGLERALDRRPRRRAAPLVHRRASHRHTCSSAIRSARSSSGRSRARTPQRSQDSCSSIRCILRNGATHPEAAADASRRHFPVAGGRAARAPRCRPLLLSLLSGGAPAAPRRSAACSAGARRRSSSTWSMKFRNCLRSAALGAGALVESESVSRHVAAPRSAACMLAGSRTEADAFGEIPVVVLSAGARDARWLAADAGSPGPRRTGVTRSPRSGHWVHLDDPELVMDYEAWLRASPLAM